MILFSKDNITTKRPGNGVNPINYWRLLGTEATNDYQIGELINE